MTYSLVTADNPVLRRVAEPWKFDVDGSPVELVNEMIKIATAANGVGLAAPQIGISKRIFVAYVNWLGPDGSGISPTWSAFINPTYHSVDLTAQFGEEGCLSLPNVRVGIHRFNHINLEYLTEAGIPRMIKLFGDYSRIIQHEVDHLNGVLITDYYEWENKWESPLGVTD